MISVGHWSTLAVLMMIRKQLLLRVKVDSDWQLVSGCFLSGLFSAGKQNWRYPRNWTLRIILADSGSVKVRLRGVGVGQVGYPGNGKSFHRHHDSRREHSRLHNSVVNGFKYIKQRFLQWYLCIMLYQGLADTLVGDVYSKPFCYKTFRFFG